MRPKKYLALFITFLATSASLAEPLPTKVDVEKSSVNIDCNYHIAAQTKKIDSAIIVSWAEKAVVQSFDFNHTTITEQLNKLKACYTDQGWESFQTAFQKSGNMQAIQAQHLSVSSQIEGTPTVKPLQEGYQWKVTLPLRVVYQNEQQRLTQRLNIDLRVGRKMTGDLGIMQLVAIPQMKPNP